MSQSEQQNGLSEQQLSEIKAKAQAMSDDALKMAVQKLMAASVKRNEYTKKRNEEAKTDPAKREKMIQLRQKYNQSDAAKERRKAYFQANKEKIYASHKAYHQRQKALIEEAKRRGLDKEVAQSA